MNVEELEARLQRIEARLDAHDAELEPARRQRLKREAAEALADALKQREGLPSALHRFTDDEQ